MGEPRVSDTLTAMLKEAKLKRARPWEPISDDYLSAREFLSLVGIHGKGRGYRRALCYLRLAAGNSDILNRTPDSLKDCFQEGLVCVHSFRGSTGGAVGIEYRIPIESLNGKYAHLAKKLIPARHSKNPYAVPISRHAFRGLTVLSKREGKSTSELIGEWVQEELEHSFAHEPPSTEYP